jgi:hypothetical protein
LPLAYEPGIGAWSLVRWCAAQAAEPDAEGIEHQVSKTTLRAFRRFLNS